jgi:hypothetical protein
MTSATQIVEGQVRRVDAAEAGPLAQLVGFVAVHDDRPGAAGGVGGGEGHQVGVPVVDVEAVHAWQPRYRSGSAATAPVSSVDGEGG